MFLHQKVKSSKLKSQEEYQDFSDAQIKSRYNNDIKYNYDRVEEIYQENLIREKANKEIVLKNLEELKEFKRYIEDFGISMKAEVKRGVSISEFINKTFEGFCRDRSEFFKSRYGSIKKRQADEAKSKDVAEIAQNHELEKKKKERLIASIAVRHGIDIMLECVEVMECLLKKDKILHLAHYMEKNRSDWSEGYSYVERALKEFHPETDEERNIFNGVSRNLERAYEQGEMDGRIFRDGSYNYNDMFYLVEKKSQEFYEDYKKLKTLCEE
jgi:hypothetical protein